VSVLCWLALAAFTQPAEAGSSRSIEDVKTAVLGTPQRVTSGSRDFHGSIYREDAASTLRNFAQELEGRSKKPVNSGVAWSTDNTYADLHDYVRRIGTGRSKGDVALRDFAQGIGTVGSKASRAGETKVAEAGSLFEAWRELLSKGGTGQLKSPAVRTPAPKRDNDEEEATYVGDKVCLGCHTTLAASFERTLMGRIFKHPRNAQEKIGCEGCHGAGSAHVKAGGGRGVGGIISFRSDDRSRTAEENNAICLSCHEKGARTYWSASMHETRGLACTNCHTVMKSVSAKHQLAKKTEIETCFQCHKLRRAQMQRTSHMPLHEGKMTCTGCHNPHGSASESLLKEVSINDTCYACHAEKRGPFLWEHAPVRENCLNCHESHGSNNEFLLKVARPRLCALCHTETRHPGRPQNPASRFAFNRSCQNCHSQIHGSNSPAGVRFQR